MLASNGYSGVNLHGGTGKSVANSVGGFLPGDDILRESRVTIQNLQAETVPNADLADRAATESERQLELRLLNVPALYLMSVWLQSRSDDDDAGPGHTHPSGGG